MKKSKLSTYILTASTLFFGVSCETDDQNQLSGEQDSVAFLEDSLLIEEFTVEVLTEFDVQELFESEISDVVNAIAEEDYVSARDMIERIFTTEENLTTAQKAYLRFMHLYSFAGLVYQGVEIKSELEGLFQSYKGEYLITHHYPVTDEFTIPFNSIWTEDDAPDDLHMTLTNGDGFNIHCFVRATIPNHGIPEHKNERAYVAGKLNSYRVSEGEINSWISDIELSEPFITYIEE